MPVTTFDIPQSILDFMDTIVESRAVHSRRDLVVRALENLKKYEMHTWKGAAITVHGVRHGMFSIGGLRELLRDRSEKDLYETGRRMGHTLRDTALVSEGLDITLPENQGVALRMLEDSGWGLFRTSDSRIVITAPLLPSPLIHGFLETALSRALKRLDTKEDVCVLEGERI
jgi:hypothetical protein